MECATAQRDACRLAFLRVRTRRALSAQSRPFECALVTPRVRTRRNKWRYTPTGGQTMTCSQHAAFVGETGAKSKKRAVEKQKNVLAETFSIFIAYTLILFLTFAHKYSYTAERNGTDDTRGRCACR